MSCSTRVVLTWGAMSVALLAGVAHAQAQLPQAESEMAAAPPVAWLREIVQEVLTRQPELAQAAAENRQSQSRQKEARSARLPQLALTGSLGHESQALDARTNEFGSQYQAQARLSQPLLDPAVAARQRIAQAQARGADWSFMQVQDQVVLRTVELYAELVRQSRLTELARSNLKLHRNYVARVKEVARIDQGRASDLPVAQSRVALAEAVLTSRLSRLEAARVQWRAHTTLPSPDESPVAPLARVLRDLPELPMPASVEAAVDEAVAAHPVLQKALSDLQVSKESVDLAEAATKPRLGAELSRRQGHNFGGIYGDQRTWYAGINVQWNFSAADRHSVGAALEGVRAAQESVNTQSLRLRSAVQTQWFEYKAAQASLTSYQDYAAQAIEVARSTAEQFRIGRRSLLDVLNAENELFTARSNAATTQIDLQLAQWRLSSLRGVLGQSLGL